MAIPCSSILLLDVWTQKDDLPNTILIRCIWVVVDDELSERCEEMVVTRDRDCLGDEFSC